MAEPRDLHAWCRQNLALLQAGLLSETDEARLRGHLRECPDCDKDLGPLMDETPDPSTFEHIPPQMIARWKEAGDSLRGLTRQMVRHHLETCAECRQDLEAVGFEPLLPLVPELEIPVAEVPLETASMSAPRHSIRIVKPPRRASWIVGTWAAAASIAVVALLTFPKDDRVPDPVPSQPLPGAQTSGLAMEVVGVPVVLETPTREAESPENRVLLPPGTRSVTLRFAPFDVPDSTSVRIAISDASGAVVASGTYRQRELYPSKGFLLTAGSDTLAAGLYALRAVADNQELEIPFRIEISSHSR